MNHTVDSPESVSGFLYLYLEPLGVGNIGLGIIHQTAELLQLADLRTFMIIQRRAASQNQVYWMLHRYMAS
ncbi:hypothetical protein D3C74_384600 [compost metagenome]